MLRCRTVGRTGRYPDPHMTESNVFPPVTASAPVAGSPQADIYHRLLQDRIVVLGTDEQLR